MLLPQASYLTPVQSAWKESNLLLTSYKDAALTTELHAVMSEAGGIRTHALRIKSPLCFHYTTTSEQALGHRL
jgi:hypothetical protein